MNKQFSVRIFALQLFRSPECELSNYAVLKQAARGQGRERVSQVKPWAKLSWPVGPKT
jgi:hypothetical protein